MVGTEGCVWEHAVFAPHISPWKVLKPKKKFSFKCYVILIFSQKMLIAFFKRIPNVYKGDIFTLQTTPKVQNVEEIT